MLNMHANYMQTAGRYSIVNQSAVPFRLTANLQTFLTPYYEGAFELALGAVALVGLNGEDHL